MTYENFEELFSTFDKGEFRYVIIVTKGGNRYPANVYEIADNLDSHCEILAFWRQGKGQHKWICVSLEDVEAFEFLEPSDNEID